MAGRTRAKNCGSYRRACARKRRTPGQHTFNPIRERVTRAAGRVRPLARRRPMDFRGSSWPTASAPETVKRTPNVNSVAASVTKLAAKACHDAVAARPMRQAIGDEHPQREEPALEGTARQAKPLHVPATSFCEYADTKPRKTPIWFALAEHRPLFAFAGLWTSWRGMRGPKSAPVEGDHGTVWLPDD